MAENDANRVRTPPPLVCSTGRVRLYGQASSREGSDPCRRAQPVAGRSSATRRCAPTHSPPGNQGGSQETCTGASLGHLSRRPGTLEAFLRPELSLVSDGEQLWPPSEDDRGHTVPRAMGYTQEFLIMFVDCYSRYTILVPSSNHTANTVSEALLRHVVPYFGTPRRPMSDRGREFVGEIWGKLLRSLGIQRVLTSPYHPEGNAIMSVVTGRPTICSMLDCSRVPHPKHG